MSVLTVNYTQAGFNATLTPPRPGIYYPSVAISNQLTQTFVIQNGVNQDYLPVQTAQLFAVPTAGGAVTIQPQPRNYPYGSWLGPIQAVWFEPTDSPGSYPVTLGALVGLVQWTPPVTLSGSAIYVVPGTTLSSVLISEASDTTETITITGVQSSAVLGSANLAGQTSVQIPLVEGTIDTVFAITSSSPITAIVSLFVGLAPVVSQGGGGGGGSPVFYASLTGPGETASPGALTQAGGFTVNDSTGEGITLETVGNVNGITIGGSGGAAIAISNADAGITIGTTASATGTQIIDDFEILLETTTLNSRIILKPSGFGPVVIGIAASDLLFFDDGIHTASSQGTVTGALSTATSVADLIPIIQNLLEVLGQGGGGGVHGYNLIENGTT